MENTTKIYDYRYQLPYSYIVQRGGKFVLLDVRMNSVTVSRETTLFCLFVRREKHRLKEGSAQYKQVLKTFNSVLKRLPETEQRKPKSLNRVGRLKQYIYETYLKKIAHCVDRPGDVRHALTRSHGSADK